MCWSSSQLHHSWLWTSPVRVGDHGTIIPTGPHHPQIAKDKILGPPNLIPSTSRMHREILTLTLKGCKPNSCIICKETKLPIAIPLGTQSNAFLKSTKLMQTGCAKLYTHSKTLARYKCLFSCSCACVTSLWIQHYQAWWYILVVLLRGAWRKVGRRLCLHTRLCTSTLVKLHRGFSLTISGLWTHCDIEHQVTCVQPPHKEKSS